MRIAAAFFLVALSNPAIPADLVDGVPGHFLGEWNAVLEHCGTGSNDSVLRIERHHIYFWESHGPIKAVVASGELEIALITELSGEGQTWLSTTHFKLSPEKDTLVYTGGHGSGFVRHRCPTRK